MTLVIQTAGSVLMITLAQQHSASAATTFVEHSQMQDGREPTITNVSQNCCFV
jgi:hypothetical protein